MTILGGAAKSVGSSAAYIYDLLTESSPEPIEDPIISFSDLSKVANATALPFVALTLLEELTSADAAMLYVKDLKTGTQFELSYNLDEFPKLASAVSQVAWFLVEATAQATYKLVGSPQCMTADHQPGPKIDVSVDTGQGLSDDIKKTLSTVMKPLCDDYFNSHSSSSSDSSVNSKTELMIFVCFVGAAVLGCLGCYLVNRYKEHRTYAAIVDDVPPAYPGTVPMPVTPVPRAYPSYTRSTYYPSSSNYSSSNNFTIIDVGNNNSSFFPYSESSSPKHHHSPKTDSYVAWNDTSNNTSSFFDTSNNDTSTSTFFDTLSNNATSTSTYVDTSTNDTGSYVAW